MGTYSVGLVGESKYQPHVKKLRVGECVHLTHEPDNKYDRLAVVATSARGEVLGYIPRDTFVQRIVAEEGGVVFATVLELLGGTKGKPSLGVILEVKTAKDAAAAEESWSQLSSRSGCLGLLLLG